VREGGGDMKLVHAIKLARQCSLNEPLTPEQMIAIFVLAELGDRVAKAKPTVRALYRAIDTEDLNQQELLVGTEKVEE